MKFPFVPKIFSEVLFTFGLTAATHYLVFLKMILEQ
jgi:hypothetical protein